LWKRRFLHKFKSIEQPEPESWSFPTIAIAVAIGVSVAIDAICMLNLLLQEEGVLKREIMLFPLKNFD
jgi:hypothetical protein